MQRFKKEMVRKFGYRSGVHVDLAQQPINATRYGKFVYGANGTLSQAARFRASGFSYLSASSVSRGFWNSVRRSTMTRRSEISLARMNVRSMRDLVDAARRGGCRLPA